MPVLYRTFRVATTPRRESLLDERASLVVHGVRLNGNRRSHTYLRASEGSSETPRREALRRESGTVRLDSVDASCELRHVPSDPGPLSAMSRRTASDERYGEVFDAVAEAYDRERPSYPHVLVDTACAIAGVGPGSPVLEVGCGTGKLTRTLVERGLLVDAVDPGPNMIAFARRQTGGAARFHVGRFEDVELPERAYDAVFSATAFHWVDPAVSWAKAAALLRPHGTLALVMFITYLDNETGEDNAAIHDIFERHLPPRAGIGRPLRDLACLCAGFEERSGDVSAVWTWLGHDDLTSPEAPRLFGEVTLTTAIDRREQTAEQLWAFFETTSTCPRLDREVREALRRDLGEAIDRLGGTLRSNELCVLVTARARQAP